MNMGTNHKSSGDGSVDSDRGDECAMTDGASTVTDDTAKIEEEFDITDWAKQGEGKRYMLKHLIKPKNKIDERIDFMHHSSDQVVWNIIYLKKKNKVFPSCSPTKLEIIAAGKWLKSFRSQIVKQMMKMARGVYFEESRKEGWKKIAVDGKPFSSFSDLEKRTRECNNELVSRKSMSLSCESVLICNVYLVCFLDSFVCGQTSNSCHETVLEVQILCQ